MSRVIVIEFVSLAGVMQDPDAGTWQREEFVDNAGTRQMLPGTGVSVW